MAGQQARAAAGRERQQAQRERAEAQREARAERAFSGAVAALKTGKVGLEAVLAAFPDMDSTRIPILSDMAKEFKKQAKLAEKKQTDEQVGNVASDQFRALGPGGTSAQLENTRNQRQDLFAGLSPEETQRRDIQLEAGVDTFEQARAAAIDKQERTERFELAKAGRSEFVKNGALLLSSEKMPRRELYGMAVEQFGEQHVVSIMGQIDTAAAAAGASEADDKIQWYLEDGADLMKARLAADGKGKAFKDPLTGLYMRGSPTGAKEAKASSNKGMIAAVSVLRSLGDAVAFSDEGGVFTGSIADLQAKVGSTAPPELTAFIVAAQWAVTSIAYALSGAQYAEEFLDRIEKLVPTFAEMQLVDGKMAPSFLARMDTLERIIEGNHLALMDRSDRAASRASIAEFRKIVLEETKTESYFKEVLSRPDPDGRAVLEDLYDDIGIQP